MQCAIRFSVQIILKTPAQVGQNDVPAIVQIKVCSTSCMDVWMCVLYHNTVASSMLSLPNRMLSTLCKRRLQVAIQELFSRYSVAIR